MPRIVVSERACEMLQRHALEDVRAAAQRQEDGSMAVVISDALHDELKAQKFPAETLSAVILRYLPTRGVGRR